MTRDAATTSRIMGKIRGEITTPELILKRGSHRNGHSIQSDTKNRYGRPDISIMKY